MDKELIKARVKYRTRLALPILGAAVVLYFILYVIGVRDASDLTVLVGCIFFLPFITFRNYMEHFKSRK